MDALLPVVLLVGVATLTAAIGALRSSRRSEDLGENRYELLRDQYDRLELLREERRMLIEELERESQERQQFIKALKGVDPQIIENLQRERKDSARIAEQREQQQLRLEQEYRRLQEELEQERQDRLEDQRRTERSEQEHRERLTEVQQEAERLRQERQRLTEDLKGARKERQEAQKRAKELEQEHRRLISELDKLRRLPVQDQAGKPEADRPWWRNPILVGMLLLGVLVLWFVSLVVALNLLSP